MGVIDLIFPKSCVNCGKSGKYICETCVSELKPVGQICCVCSRPAIDGITHVKCTAPWAMDRLVSIWQYKGVIKAAIVNLKYKYATEIAKELCFQIVSEIKKGHVIPPKNAILIPVPMHKKRQRERGFNQASEIGELMSRQLDLKFTEDVLLRKKLVRAQATLKGKERRDNIKGVFSLNPKYSLRRSKSTFVLFDDVYTTGSTLKEAGKVLKRNGAENVWGFTIAR